ncbi:MAG: UDP-N-acetylmuramate:L-alanyl-gamma-D-glutamyl-meso-diaminopimelate ligase [bacterium]|nr:UDP-N-acetylmuramate:L-alanyl-gamma-D-glutamyl-meso-diaminopimelate ligase [bacterium]
MKDNISHIHFIGIAGTAMGTVAVELSGRGYRITGSDKNVYPPISTLLDSNSIEYSRSFDTGNLSPEPDLVVIGNALSRGNPEVETCLRNKIPFVSLPELINDLFIGNNRSIVITGTHGKSTTSALTAWIWSFAGKKPGYLIGGIPKNMNNGCRFVEEGDFIIEGDEYDTAFFDKRSKFIHYSPDTLIINNIELDHVDIFRDIEDVKRSFRHLINIVPAVGVIIANYDDDNVREIVEEHPVIKGSLVKKISYGFNDDCDFVINEPRYSEMGMEIDLKDNDGNSMIISSRFAGKHQAYNISAAVIAAINNGIEREVIVEAVSGFKGMVRRMDQKAVIDDIRIIDDFAHHPTAIRETLNGAKQIFPGKRLWAVFEPRSNTMRRKVFEDELVDAFKSADKVILAGINNPEKVNEEERLLPENIIQKLENSGKDAWFIENVEEIVGFLVHELMPGDVVIGMSNGSFGNLHEKLISSLSAAHF